LRQIGYYSGPLDGVSGPQTRSAILAFEKDRGLTPSGTASDELLVAIRAASRPDLAADAIPPTPAAAGAEGAAAPENAAPDPLITAIQNALSRSAYGPLTADGLLGQQTRDAIMRFQRDHNLPVTGEISDALVVELHAIGALEGG
jgi:peptidoglycan hydrolase-like protein with peptidoglycan-binding domain